MKQRPFVHVTVRVAAAALALASCASAPELLRERTAGLRYGDECATARARARARTPESLTNEDRPKVAKIFMTTPPPAGLKGMTADVTMRVDSTGAVMKNGVTVHGVRNAQDESFVRKAAALTLYRPAVLDGCAVEGIAKMTYTF